MDVFIRGYLEDVSLRNDRRDELFEKITAQKVILRRLVQKHEEMTMEKYEKDKETMKRKIEENNDKLNGLIKSLQDDVAGIATNQFNTQKQEVAASMEKKNLREKKPKREKEQKKQG